VRCTQPLSACWHAINSWFILKCVDIHIYKRSKREG
jgi:hypothetical protein